MFACGTFEVGWGWNIRQGTRNSSCLHFLLHIQPTCLFSDPPRADHRMCTVEWIHLVAFFGFRFLDVSYMSLFRPNSHAAHAHEDTGEAPTCSCSVGANFPLSLFSQRTRTRPPRSQPRTYNSSAHI